MVNRLPSFCHTKVGDSTFTRRNQMREYLLRELARTHNTMERQAILRQLYQLEREEQRTAA